MNRGARHEPVFWTDKDCGEFLGLVDALAPRFRVEVHAYALMPNHFHLLVVSQGQRLSDFMSGLCGGYARHLNRVPRRDGPVWRGRFKSRHVTEEADWQHLSAYVHLNPVRAGLVDGARAARWTSLDGYLHGSRALACLRTDALLAAFGGLAPMLAYIDDVQRKRRPPPPGFDAQDLWKVPRSQTARPVPPARPVARSPEQALAEVCAITGRTREDLFSFRPGAPNRAAWIAAWWLQEGAGLTQREVGCIMGVRQTGVAQRGRLLRRDAQREDVAGWMAALRATSGRGTTRVDPQ